MEGLVIGLKLYYVFFLSMSIKILQFGMFVVKIRFFWGFVSFLFSQLVLFGVKFELCMDFLKGGREYFVIMFFFLVFIKYNEFMFISRLYICLQVISYLVGDLVKILLEEMLREEK